MNAFQNGFASKMLEAPAVKNPFINTTQLTWTQILKALVCFILLFPIRFLGSIVVFFILVALSHVILYNQRPEDSSKPMTSWRKHLRNSFSHWTRAILFFLGFHWIRVKGKVAPPTEAPLMVLAPHSSWLDVLVMCVAGVPSGLSKMENMDAPFIGAFFRAIQCIPVSRGEKNSRQNAVGEIKRRVAEGMHFPQIVICPEGTCTNRKSLISYKGGAFYPGCPVQPVCIKYNADPDIISWTWIGYGMVPLIVLLFCQFNNSVEVEFLPVHIPTKEEKENPVLFSQRVRTKMARCLGIPMTDHSYEDCILMQEGNNAGLPMEAGLVEYQKLNRELGVNLDYLKEEIKKFASMDRDKDGLITVEDFAHTLNVTASSPVTELFTLYDPTRRGVIDFRQFVIGNHLVMSLSQKEEVRNKASEVLRLYWEDNANSTEEIPDDFQQIVQSCLQSMKSDIQDFSEKTDFHDMVHRIVQSCPGYILLLSHLHPEEKLM